MGRCRFFSRYVHRSVFDSIEARVLIRCSVARKHESRHYQDPRRHTQRDQSLSPHLGSHVCQSSGSSGQTVIRKAQPPLHHPVPCRPTLQQLLSSHSSDSENPASTKAQVGLQRPDVPPSQTEENEAWREFVAGADHGQIMSDLQSSDSKENPGQSEISPGVSQVGLSKRANERSKNEEVYPPESEVDNKTTMDQAEQTHMLDNLMRTDPSEASFACKDAQKNFSSASFEPRQTSLQPCLSLSDWDSEAACNKVHRGPSSPPENLDDMSLLVVPRSSSTSSEDILNRFDIVPVLEKQQVGSRKTKAPTQRALLQAEQHQAKQSSKLLRAQDPSRKTGEDMPSKSSILEAENDVWRNFVLGGSDGSLEHAYEEARKETARNLRPSDTSAGTEEEDASEATYPHADPTEASVASGDRILAVDATDSAEGHDQSSAGASVASISHRATTGDSSPDPLSEPIPPYSDTTIQTGQATAGSPDPSTNELSNLIHEFSRRNEDWSFATREVNKATYNANPDEQAKENDNFKFARPKPFLGKQVSHIDEQQQIALSAPQIRGKPQNQRRQKKRTADGRTSVRKLPNFSSDPIEEVDEDVQIKGAQKPSLFGSLDVQEGF